MITLQMAPNPVARVRTQACAGFTLLEVVIAAGLSIVVVLLAYSAIRMAGKAVSSMERASIQGTMLRTAFILVSEETRPNANTDISSFPFFELSMIPPPPNWPGAKLYHTSLSGPSGGYVLLENKITGVSTKIDLAITGVRDVP